MNTTITLNLLAVVFLAALGGTVPCVLLYLFARWAVRAGLVEMHEKARVDGKCPVCKRETKAFDEPCENNQEKA